MQHMSATDSKIRILTSALRHSESNSVTKSVKFNSSRYSRVICEDQFIDNEEKIPEPEAKKLFDDDNDEDDIVNEKDSENLTVINQEVISDQLEISEPMNDEEMSVDQENKQKVEIETGLNDNELPDSNPTPEKQSEQKTAFNGKDSNITPEKQAEGRRLSTHVFQAGATTPPSQVKPLSFIMKASKEFINAEKEAEKAANGLFGEVGSRHGAMKSMPKRSPMKKTLKFDVSTDDSIEFDKEADHDNSIGFASPTVDTKEQKTGESSIFDNMVDSPDKNKSFNKRDNQSMNSEKSICMTEETDGKQK